MSRREKKCESVDKHPPFKVRKRMNNHDAKVLRSTLPNYHASVTMARTKQQDSRVSETNKGFFARGVCGVVRACVRASVRAPFHGSPFIHLFTVFKRESAAFKFAT